MSSPRSLLLVVVLLGALAALAAGCGGGGNETAPAASTAAASTGAAPPAASTGAAAVQPPATSAAVPAPAPATLKVALDWFPNPDHVSLYYALEKGYYSDQALTVQFKKPSDPSAGLKLVATNKFDLAIYYEGDMFFAAQSGLPVIAVGALIPTPLNSLIALSDSKVQGPGSIKGATIGVAGLPFDDATLTTIRAKEGLSKDEVKSVNVGFNLVPALLTKKVDAIIGGYRNIEGIEVKLKTGKPPVIVTLEQLGVPSYDELVIVANKDRLGSDPAYADAVKRFLAAMIKGTEGAMGDEAGSIDIMKKDTEYPAKQVDEMVPATIALLKPPTGLPVGCLGIKDWQSFGKWLADHKLLKAPIDATTVATDDYLPNPC